MLKKSTGNMYDWVTHMHCHLGGECPHKCVYCYVQKNRFGVSPRYKGEPRLIRAELDVNYGTGKTIFIEHMNDIFAEGVQDDWITEILNHCGKYEGNTYVFQTKNPGRAREFSFYGIKKIFGTTIETNRDHFFLGGRFYEMSKAPTQQSRAFGMMVNGWKKFVTIEPILDFDVEILVGWMKEIKPEFVNIGADSKGCKLPEPPAEKVRELIAKLREAKITIRKKSNLARLLK